MASAAMAAARLSFGASSESLSFGGDD